MKKFLMNEIGFVAPFCLIMLALYAYAYWPTDNRGPELDQKLQTYLEARRKIYLNDRIPDWSSQEIDRDDTNTDQSWSVSLGDRLTREYGLKPYVPPEH